MVINIGLESPQNQAAEVFNKQLDASASIVIALQVKILSSSLCEQSDKIIITIIIVLAIQVNILSSSLCERSDDIIITIIIVIVMQVNIVVFYFN